MAMNSFWRPIGIALIVFSSLLATTVPAAAVWDHAHGDGANTGFARVDTAPAGKPQQVVQLGRLAPGAGPVIGPSGTLYVANIDGKVLAFQPDGSPAWNRILPSGSGSFFASPVVGADGSVYVASMRQARDHRNGTTFTRYDSTLHKFSGDGGVLWAVPLPVRPVDPPTAPALAGWPAAVAPPSIWRSGSTEVIVMPVLYKYPSAAELRVLAFSTQSGAVLGNALVNSKVFDVAGSVPELNIPFRYTSPHLGDPLHLSKEEWPMPGVAIAADPGGGAPLVIASDWLKRDTAAYRFDPASGFTEAWRVHDSTRTRTSAPTDLPDRQVVALGAQEGDGRRGRMSFAGPQGPAHDRPLGSWVVSPPTRMADGRIATIEFEGQMTVFRGGIVDRSFPLVGQSIASAAASCTHVFVASVGAFTTYNANTLAQVAQVPWSGGGRASPVIGPAGHVYGVTHAADDTDSLFVWPPPQRTTAIGLVGTACDRVIVRPQR